MVYIKLTTAYNGSPVYVNTANITTIEPYSYDESCTVVNLVGGAHIMVAETAEKVVKCIYQERREEM